MILEKAYSKRVGISHRKKYAQFFTPEEVAGLMVDWVGKHDSLEKVLEPAFGLGIFSRLLLKKKPDLAIKGFEIDPVIFKEAQKAYLDYPKMNLVLEDYLFHDWENKYDGILCNPPYFKFKDYENKKTLGEISNRLGIKLNAFANIYTLFLLKSIYQLKENGKAAYIVPSEFLNADYGKFVKQYLVESKALRHVIIFDSQKNVFNEVSTTSVILLLSKDQHASSVSFTSIESKEHFKRIKRELITDKAEISSRKLAHNELDPSIKWRTYYQKQVSNKYHHLVPFNQIAKVVRGIATGANEYFVFNKEKANQLRITHQYLLPCITKSKDVNTPFFTKQHFEKLVEEDANVYLFNAGKNPTNPEVLNYIQMGEENGVHEKFLTSRRNPWYIHENRPPSPIWVSVFNREKVKFIRNEAGVSNLTTFHCIYLKSEFEERIGIDLLFAYLLTGIAKEIFSDNHREYGDGLKKFEPNDLNNGLMLDLSLLPDEEKLNIKSLYLEYRKSIMNGAPNDALVGKIENTLKERFGK